RENRAHFTAHGVTALNLVSSPGSGKTTLLCASLRLLRERLPDLPLAVIEGDQQTSLDADRIRATGVPAIQVNTGKGCHLDAPMVAAAFARLHAHDHAHEHPHAHEHAHDHAHEHPHAHAHEHPHAHDHPHDHTHAHDHATGADSLLFIENVGNLVCPALWDLGEAARVVVLSVTEGEDKPRKYPDMFATARLMVLTKVDLLPYVTFDVARCVAMAREVNPGIEVLQVSATTGAGMDDWIAWLLALMGHGATTVGPQAAEVAALRARVAELEAELGRRQGSAKP
ncbi:MAG TPA: hydrogenase accessory protein HypB, partial [Gammaproteobacteria bacterium]|nr:hydrogenase accessory protein HypB [Gammaproteobacteria bacterium]